MNDRTITNWEAKGLPVQEKPGRGKSNVYFLPDVIAWRVHFVESGKVAETPKERKDRLYGDMLELKLLKESESIIAVEDIEPIWENAVVAARAVLMGSPRKLKKKLKKEFGIDVELSFLMDHVYETLNRLAESDPGPDADDDVDEI